MSMLSMVRGWRASRGRRKLEALAEGRGHATAEELEEIDKHRHKRFSTLLTGDLPEGTGISPTGTPIDFTADEKSPPPY